MKRETLTRNVWFDCPDREDIVGTADDPEHYIYRRKDNGVFFREAVLDSGLGGKPVEILAIGDMHFNSVNDEDLQNEELADTHAHRFWNRDGASEASAVKAMEVARHADQTVIVGDTLDFLSKGGMEMMERLVWKVDPKVLVALGGHDSTREMQTGHPDKEPLESRYRILEAFWRHDIYYTSKTVGDKVLIAVLDNGLSRYHACQIDRLRADIAYARERRIPMVIVQHEPICSRNPEETPLLAIRGNDGDRRDLLHNAIGASPEEDDATKTVCRLLTENADVIRVILCGHLHGDYFSTIKGSYAAADGSVVPCDIRQYILTANVYDGQAGHVFRLTVR